MTAAAALDEGVPEPTSSWHRLCSSYREQHPADTLHRAMALAPSLGITRVTDITRMDRLGLPVAVSVRPRGAVLRVHAGKGVRLLDARVGAVMEAIEYAAAEPQRSHWLGSKLTIAHLAEQFEGLFTMPALRPRLGEQVDADAAVACVPCEELNGRRSLQVPAALVFTPFDPDDEGTRLYGTSTTGLASGNSLDEATLHALLEVLERDAVSMNKARDESSWVPHALLPEPFAGLAARWAADGIDLAVRCIPNEFGLPCFTAHLHDRQAPCVRFAGGSGLHLDIGIALARAICEAAQSRLGQIHGGREDVTDLYHPLGAREPDRAAAEEALHRRLFDRRRTLAEDDLPTSAATAPTLAEVLAHVLTHIATAGFGCVFRYRFDIDLHGLHVVKVVVPRCEDIELDRRRVGSRLLSRVLGHAA